MNTLILLTIVLGYCHSSSLCGSMCADAGPGMICSMICGDDVERAALAVAYAPSCPFSSHKERRQECIKLCPPPLSNDAKRAECATLFEQPDCNDVIGQLQVCLDAAAGITPLDETIHQCEEQLSDMIKQNMHKYRMLLSTMAICNLIIAYRLVSGR